jgi:hypothetical protein
MPAYRPVLFGISMVYKISDRMNNYTLTAFCMWALSFWVPSNRSVEIYVKTNKIVQLLLCGDLSMLSGIIKLQTIGVLQACMPKPV